MHGEHVCIDGVDHPDAAVPKGDQPVRGLAAGKRAVDVDMREGPRLLRPSMRDEGRRMVQQIGDAFVVAARAGQQDAVHPLALDQMPIGAHLVSTGPRGRHQHIQARRLQGRTDGRKQAQEERVVELAGTGGQHDPHRLAAPAAQPPRGLVRLVADTRRPPPPPARASPPPHPRIRPRRAKQW